MRPATHPERSAHGVMATARNVAVAGGALVFATVFVAPLSGVGAAEQLLPGVDAVRAVALNDNGSLLFAAFHDKAVDQNVIVAVDTRTGIKRWRIGANENGAKALVTPAGVPLVVEYSDLGLVRVLDSDTGEVIRTLQLYDEKQLGWTRQEVITGLFAGREIGVFYTTSEFIPGQVDDPNLSEYRLIRWDARSGEQLLVVTLNQEHFSVKQLAVSDGGAMVALLMYDSVELRRVEDGVRLWRTPAANRHASWIQFADEGASLLVDADQRRVSQLSVADGSVIHTRTEDHWTGPIASLSNERYVAFVDREVESATGRYALVLMGGDAPPEQLGLLSGRLWHLVASRDARTVVTFSTEAHGGDLQVWRRGE